MYPSCGQTTLAETSKPMLQEISPNTTPAPEAMPAHKLELEPVNPTPQQPADHRQCCPIAGDRYMERFLHKQVNQTLADKDRCATVRDETTMEADADSLRTNSAPEDPNVILEQIEPPRPATPAPEPGDDLPPGEPMDIDLAQIWRDLTGMQVGMDEEEDTLEMVLQWMHAPGQTTKATPTAPKKTTQTKGQQVSKVTTKIAAPTTPPKLEPHHDTSALWANEVMCIGEAHAGNEKSIQVPYTFINGHTKTGDRALLNSGAMDNFIDQ